MTPDHMKAAGVDPARAGHARAMAELAEQDAAERLGGTWVGPGLENAKRGDVRLPDGSYVEVKFISARGPLSSAVVNLGDHLPPAKATVLVYREPEPGVVTPVGWVVRKMIRHGRPPAFGDRAQLCYFTAGSELRPYLHEAGTPLGLLRRCPACADDHPAGTTCAGGWAPYEPAAVKLPWEDD